MLLAPRTLAGRLTLTFVIAGLLITFLSAGVSEYFFRGQLEALAQSRLEHYAKLVAAKLSRDRAERVEDLQRLGTHEVLFKSPVDPETVREHLERTREDFGLAWLAVADPSGRVVVASGGHLEGTSVAEASWFIEGRTQLHIGSDLPVASLSAALEMNGRFMAIAVPVKDSQGNPVGVLCAQQFLSYNTEYSPLPLEAAREEIFASAYTGADGRWLLGSAGSNRKLPAPSTVKKFHSWRETYDGVGYLVGFARTAAYRGVRDPGWLVSVRQPTEKVFAPARRLRERVVGWGSGLTFVLAIVVGVSVRPISTRIKSIARSAAHLRQGGDPGATMPAYQGTDDLSRMSVKVHDLVEHLRKDHPAPAPKSALLPNADVPEASGKDYVRPSGSDPRRVVW
jgi:hypothetical protein